MNRQSKPKDREFQIASSMKDIAAEADQLAHLSTQKGWLRGRKAEKLRELQAKVDQLRRDLWQVQPREKAARRSKRRRTEGLNPSLVDRVLAILDRRGA